MRAANADKLKARAIVNVTVRGVSLDFIELAKDATGLPSPSEDAKTRDITINALFYNINEGKVEDWTG